MHAQMQPARLPRTGESDSLERREGVVRDPGLISRYRSLQEALDVTEAYETAFFINDFAPGDRRQRLCYVHEIQLPFAFELYHYHQGGNLGTLW